MEAKKETLERIAFLELANTSARTKGNRHDQILDDLAANLAASVTIISQEVKALRAEVARLNGADDRAEDYEGGAPLPTTHRDYKESRDGQATEKKDEL